MVVCWEDGVVKCKHNTLLGQFVGPSVYPLCLPYDSSHCCENCMQQWPQLLALLAPRNSVSLPGAARRVLLAEARPAILPHAHPRSGSEQNPTGPWWKLANKYSLTPCHTPPEGTGAHSTRQLKAKQGWRQDCPYEWLAQWGDLDWFPLLPGVSLPCLLLLSLGLIS